MAVIKQGILGGFSGKVGSVIGTSWKGLAVMKSMPLSVANPQTAAQVGNRVRFAAIGNLAVLLGVTYMNNFWARFAVKMTGFNLFTSTNKAAFSTAGVFTPASLKACDGSINAADVLTHTVNAATGACSVTWTDTASGEQLVTDELQLIVINAAGTAVSESAVVTLEDGGTSVTTTMTHTAGTHLHFYIIGRRADGTKTYIQAYYDVTAA